MRGSGRIPDMRFFVYIFMANPCVAVPILSMIFSNYGNGRPEIMDDDYDIYRAAEQLFYHGICRNLFMHLCILQE